MHNAVQQFGPGAANNLQSVPFNNTEATSNNVGSLKSLRQFRKKDLLDKQSNQDGKPNTNTESPPSHVARVAPHNHFPNRSHEYYSYNNNQYQDYSIPYKDNHQVKYSEITDTQPVQPDQISPTVIQKPKNKDYMDMMTQAYHKHNYPDHLSPQQNYPDPSVPHSHQYMYKDQGINPHPYNKPSESQYYPKEQYQMGKYNISPHATRKYPTPTGSENAFLAQLQRIRPSMARNIMSDHHMRETQGTYAAGIDQNRLYASPSQNSSRYYGNAVQNHNMYPPAQNYGIPPHQYHNNYPTTHPQNFNYKPDYGRPTQRFPPNQPNQPHMERSISPGHYPDMGMQMGYPGINQKIPPAYHPYNTPEYAQHYQHRRTNIPQEFYPQHSRPQYLPDPHIAIEVPEIPSDNMKQFYESFKDEAISEAEKIAKEGNSETVVNEVRADVINENELRLLETQGYLSTENGHYYLKNGVVHFVENERLESASRVLECNSDQNEDKSISLQVSNVSGPNILLEKDENLVQTLNNKVVIHSNTVIMPVKPIADNLIIAKVDSELNIPEKVDKNCSPITPEDIEQLNTINQSNLGQEEETKTNEDFKEELLKTDEGSNPISELKDMPFIDLNDLQVPNDVSNDGSIVTTNDGSNNNSNDNNNDGTNVLLKADEECKAEDLTKKKITLDDIRDSEENVFSFDNIVESKNDETKIEGSNIKEDIVLVKDNTVSCIKELKKIHQNVVELNEENNAFENKSNIIEQKIENNVILNHFETKDLKHKTKEIEKCDSVEIKSLKKSSESLEQLSSFKKVEKIESETKETNNPEENEESNKIPTPTQMNVPKPKGMSRRNRRIFSVDDIINNIGKRKIIEVEKNICSIECTKEFLEKEIEVENIVKVNNNLNEIKPNIQQNKYTDNKDNENLESVNLYNKDTDKTDVESIFDDNNINPDKEDIKNLENIICDIKHTGRKDVDAEENKKCLNIAEKSSYKETEDKNIKETKVNLNNNDKNIEDNDINENAEQNKKCLNIAEENIYEETDDNNIKEKRDNLNNKDGNIEVTKIIENAEENKKCLNISEENYYEEVKDKNIKETKDDLKNKDENIEDTEETENAKENIKRLNIAEKNSYEATKDKNNKETKYNLNKRDRNIEDTENNKNAEENKKFLNIAEENSYEETKNKNIKETKDNLKNKDRKIEDTEIIENAEENKKRLNIAVENSFEEIIDKNNKETKVNLKDKGRNIEDTEINFKSKDDNLKESAPIKEKYEDKPAEMEELEETNYKTPEGVITKEKHKEKNAEMEEMKNKNKKYMEELAIKEVYEEKTVEMEESEISSSNSEDLIDDENMGYAENESSTISSNFPDENFEELKETIKENVKLKIQEEFINNEVKVENKVLKENVVILKNTQIIPITSKSTEKIEDTQEKEISSSNNEEDIATSDRECENINSEINSSSSLEENTLGKLEESSLIHSSQTGESSSSSDVQYRSAIKIEENSVLLQIAGELVEINVNIINGKKVITLVPLSETSEVDFNDNYETMETVHINADSAITDQIESSEEIKNVPVENEKNIEPCISETTVLHKETELKELTKDEENEVKDVRKKEITEEMTADVIINNTVIEEIKSNVEVEEIIETVAEEIIVNNEDIKSPEESKSFLEDAKLENLMKDNIIDQVSIPCINENFVQNEIITETILIHQETIFSSDVITYNQDRIEMNSSIEEKLNIVEEIVTSIEKEAEISIETVKPQSVDVKNSKEEDIVISVFPAKEDDEILEDLSNEIIIGDESLELEVDLDLQSSEKHIQEKEKFLQNAPKLIHTKASKKSYDNIISNAQKSQELVIKKKIHKKAKLKSEEKINPKKSEDKINPEKNEDKINPKESIIILKKSKRISEKLQIKASKKKLMEQIKAKRMVENKDKQILKPTELKTKISKKIEVEPKVVKKDKESQKSSNKKSDIGKTSNKSLNSSKIHNNSSAKLSEASKLLEVPTSSKKSSDTEKKDSKVLEAPQQNSKKTVNELKVKSQNKKVKVNGKPKSDQSDDEYVCFKELIKARKLKKLQKLKQKQLKSNEEVKKQENIVSSTKNIMEPEKPVENSETIDKTVKKPKENSTNNTEKVKKIKVSSKKVKPEMKDLREFKVENNAKSKVPPNLTIVVENLIPPKVHTCPEPILKKPSNNDNAKPIRRVSFGEDKVLEINTTITVPTSKEETIATKDPRVCKNEDNAKNIVEDKVLRIKSTVIVPPVKQNVCKVKSSITVPPIKQENAKVKSTITVPPIKQEITKISTYKDPRLNKSEETKNIIKEVNSATPVSIDKEEAENTNSTKISKSNNEEIVKSNSQKTKKRKLSLQDYRKKKEIVIQDSKIDTLKINDIEEQNEKKEERNDTQENNAKATEQKLFKTENKLPEMRETVSKVTEVITEVVEVIPQVVEVTTEVVEVIPEVVEITSEVVEVNPEVVEDIPEVVERNNVEKEVSKITEKEPAEDDCSKNEKPNISADKSENLAMENELCVEEKVIEKIVDEKIKKETLTKHISQKLCERNKRPKSLDELDELCSSPKSLNLKRKMSLHEIEYNHIENNWEDSNSPKCSPKMEPKNEEIDLTSCLSDKVSSSLIKFKKKKSKKLVIDLNELNVSPDSTSTIATPKIEENTRKDAEIDSLQLYKEQVDSKLSSLNIKIPKLVKNTSSKDRTTDMDNLQKKINSFQLTSKDINESHVLMNKFLKKDYLTKEEMSKIKRIIQYKRMVQHLDKIQSPGNSGNSDYSNSPVINYEIRDQSPERGRRDLKLHLKKVPDAYQRSKKHFRNLSPVSSDSEIDMGSSSTSSRTNYSVVQRKSELPGVPKLIIKRKTESPLQPFVRLERLDMNALYIKKRKLI